MQRPHDHHAGHGAGGASGSPTARSDSPTLDRRSLDRTALSATVHCLTGCAIGEVLGMVLGTALGLSNRTTVVLSGLLAFFFGYSLTILPLLRARLGFRTAVPLAFASDTASIALMEVVDSLIMLVIPGALDAGLPRSRPRGAAPVSPLRGGSRTTSRERRAPDRD